jgi:hypothetical protein
MSNKYKTPARKIRASAIEKGVLNILADHADETGHCFPSVKTIALGCGFGETSVITAVSQLEEEGLLRVVREHGEVNHYYVNLEEIEERAKSGQPTHDDDKRRCRRAAAASSKRTAPSGAAARSIAEPNGNGVPPAGSRTQFVPPPIGDPNLWQALFAARHPSVDDVARWFQQASDYRDHPGDLNRALVLMMITPARDLYWLHHIRATRLIARSQRNGRPPSEEVLI